MNEAAREAEAWESAKDSSWSGQSSPRRMAREAFYAGWDAARTFSAEDVERVAKVLANREMGDWEFYLGDARAALDVVGTVEEAQ